VRAAAPAAQSTDLVVLSRLAFHGCLPGAGSPADLPQPCVSSLYPRLSSLNRCCLLAQLLRLGSGKCQCTVANLVAACGATWFLCKLLSDRLQVKQDLESHTRQPAPHTPHPTPTSYTIHPAPNTPHPTPHTYILHHTPRTPHPTPTSCTLQPAKPPQTLQSWATCSTGASQRDSRDLMRFWDADHVAEDELGHHSLQQVSIGGGRGYR
jgi:hypothetical protein